MCPPGCWSRKHCGCAMTAQRFPAGSPRSRRRCRPRGPESKLWRGPRLARLKPRLRWFSTGHVGTAVENLLGSAPTGSSAASYRQVDQEMLSRLGGDAHGWFLPPARLPAADLAASGWGRPTTRAMLHLATESPSRLPGHPMRSKAGYTKPPCPAHGALGAPAHAGI